MAVCVCAHASCLNGGGCRVASPLCHPAPRHLPAAVPEADLLRAGAAAHCRVRAHPSSDGLHRWFSQPTPLLQYKLLFTFQACAASPARRTAPPTPFRSPPPPGTVAPPLPLTEVVVGLTAPIDLRGAHADRGRGQVVRNYALDCEGRAAGGGVSKRGSTGWLSRRLQLEHSCCKCEASR